MALSLEKRLSKLANKKSERRNLQNRKKFLFRYIITAIVISVVAFFIWNGDLKPIIGKHWELYAIGLTGGIFLSIPVLWYYRNAAMLIFIFILSCFSSNVLRLINQAYAADECLEVVKKTILEKQIKKIRFSTSYWVDVKYDDDIKSFETSEEEYGRANYVTLTIKQG